MSSKQFASGVFDFSADSWLAIRHGRLEKSYFHDSVGFEGLITVGWELFHDFHSLMNKVWETKRKFRILKGGLL